MANELLSNEVITSILINFLKKSMSEKTDEITVNTHLFDLGVSSIEMTDYVRRIQEEFGVIISLQELVKDDVTVADTVTHLRERIAAKERNAKEKQMILSNTTELPILEYQLELWYYHNYSDELAASYNSFAIFDITGNVNEDLFRESINTLSMRYDFLRLQFQENKMVQTVSPSSKVKFESVNSETSAKEYTQSLLKKKFDIFDSVLNVYLVSEQNNPKYMVLWSHDIFFNEKNLVNLYNKILDEYNQSFQDSGEEKQEAVTPYVDYVNKILGMEDSIQSKDVKAALLNDLQDAAKNYYTLPTDKLRPHIKQYQGSRLTTKLELDTVEQIQQWCRQTKVTIFDHFSLTFALLCSRLTNSNTVTMGSYGDVSNVVGNYDFNTQNQIAMHHSLQSDETITENIKNFSKQTTKVYDHQYYPFHCLIKDLDLEKDQSRTPLFSLFFQYLEYPDVHSTNDFDSKLAILPAQYAKYDLVVTVCKIGNSHIVNFDYSTELFEIESIKNYLKLYKHMLEDVINHPELPLKDYVPVNQEQKELLEGWCGNPADFKYQSVIEKIDQACANHPDAVAIIENSEKITYRELSEKYTALANHLLTLTQGENVPVGILLPHNSSQLIAVLAAFKAGALFIPLDVEFPEARIASIAADADMKWIIMNSSSVEVGKKLEGISVVNMDQDLTTEGQSLPTISSEKTAYIMYTSGSTGKPKGAMISHRSLANFTEWLLTKFTPEDCSHTLYSSSLCFDVSLIEILLPLCNGKTVVTTDSLLLIHDLPSKDQITFINTVPSLIAEAMKRGPLPPQLKSLMLLGEPLHLELTKQIFASTGLECIVNGYGPTEATILTTHFDVTKEATSVYIGNPVGNADLLVLDENRNFTPVGGIGELYIGGEILSDGYLKRDELNAELFTQVENHNGVSGRYYKSGDLVRYTPNGDLQYVGRRDTQVKISGVRIELSEIENALNAIDFIDYSAVVLDKDTKKQLYAFLAAQKPIDQETEDKIKKQLMDTLPMHMIPHRVVGLESLPSLVSGKTDRLALQKLITTYHEEEGPKTPEDNSPMNQDELNIANSFKEILNIQEVGKHNNFFNLGGNSILVIELISQLRKLFGIKLTLRDFYKAPTPAGIVNVIQELIAEEKEKSRTNAHLFDDKEEISKRFKFFEKEASIQLEDNNLNKVTSCAEIKNLFATGMTGFLGGFTLSDLLRRTDYHIHCLVRAKTKEAALKKVIAKLEEYNLWSDSFTDRISVICGDVAEQGLGITEQEYDFIATECDAILHNAAMVNFIYPYEALRQTNVESTRQLIRLAMHKKVKTFYYVSTTAVLPLGAEFIFKETDDLHNDIALNLGYDESKWVCEKTVRNAGEQGLPYVIFRPGEVCGDATTGRIITTDFIMAVLAGCLRSKTFPQINCFIELTPVDYVSSGLVEIMKRNREVSKTFHLTNTKPMYSKDFFTWLRNRGHEFDLLGFEDWRNQIFDDENFKDNEIYPFAPAIEGFTARMVAFPIYDSTQAQTLLKDSDVSCPPLDDKLMATYMDYLDSVGFIINPSKKS